MENLHNINQNDSLFNQSIWSRISMQELLKSQEKELTKVKGFLFVSHFPPKFVDQYMKYHIATYLQYHYTRIAAFWFRSLIHIRNLK